MSWNLAKPVKVCRRIIVRRPLTVQKQMGLLTKQYAELKKGHLLYCCNQVWMKKVGGFHKMLLLSSKYSRYFVWWKDTVWKAMVRTWDPGDDGPDGVAHAGGKDELTSCRGTVSSAWQKPPVSRKGGRFELPARVNGRIVVRRRQSSPIPAQEPSVNRGSKECARVTGKAGENGQRSGEKKGRQLTLDKTVGSRVWWHTQGLSDWKVSVRSLVRIVFKKSRYRLGHRPVVTPRGGDGSRYSQAHVRATETVPSGPSVAVRYRGHWKGVCGKRMGPRKTHTAKSKKAPVGGKVFAPGCTSMTSLVCWREVRRTQALKNHFTDQSFHLIPWLNIILFPRKTSRESINLGRKYFLEYLSTLSCVRGEFGKETYWLWFLRSLKRWTHEKPYWKDACERDDNA